MSQETTVGELLARIETAIERMSVKNPHRALFIQCHCAVRSLAERVKE